MDIKRRVINLTRKYGTSDPFKIAKFLKINIIYSELGETKGFFKKILKRKFIKGDTTNQLSYSTFKPRFRKLLKELGLQEHTIHDTRHTFATMLNNVNANSTSIIKLIGHSNFSTTENIYTHKDTEELRKAVELLN